MADVHYVAHIRLEKVIRKEAVKASGYRTDSDQPATREVEEVTNITFKGKNLEHIVTKVKDALDLELDIEDEDA